MARARTPSPQTRAVIEALCDRAQAWRYGYDLSKQTGLQSGTLYPLLMRLLDQGLLEAEWRPAEQPGRPQRHAYRLTGEGLAFANALGSAAPPRRKVQPA